MCFGSLSCGSMNLSPQRSYQRVEHVSDEWGGASPSQGGVSAVQESKNSPRLNHSHHHVSLWVRSCVVSLSKLFLSVCPCFHPDKCFINVSSSSETLQDSLLLLIGVLCCLFSKFCLCDEAAFLTLSEVSLMY